MPCQWHPTTAMENAAKAGFTYDADATVIPITCTGLLKMSFLLRLFAKGIDGVLVLGCKEGDCHYYNGSKRCGEIIDEAHQILEIAGIPAERLKFALVSESQGREYKRVLRDFLKQLRRVPKRRKRVAQAGDK